MGLRLARLGLDETGNDESESQSGAEKRGNEWDSDEKTVGWNAIGMALYAATGGSEEGFKLFDAWSQRSRKYDAKVTRRRTFSARSP